MMKEFHKIRQEAQGFRRLFTDDRYDLYIWYPDGSKDRISGFQLVYKSGTDEKALTWTEKLGYAHTKVDDGDKKTNQSPILVQDGLFEYGAVYPELKKRIEKVDPDIRDFVIAKIEAFGKEHPVAPDR